ncbi:hypothetical protein ACWD04_06620 [Streptomyces sp. NPDC002911]
MSVLVLAQAVVSAVDAVGGYAGGVHLRSPPRGLLLMAVLVGPPAGRYVPFEGVGPMRTFPVCRHSRPAVGLALVIGDVQGTVPPLQPPWGNCRAPYGRSCSSGVHRRRS